MKDLCLERNDSLTQMIGLVYEANAIDVSRIAVLSFVYIAQSVSLLDYICFLYIQCLGV